MSEVVPTPSGVNVGGARTAAKHKPKARTIDTDKLDGHVQMVGGFLREAEEAVVGLGKSEAERDALYAEQSDALAEKYGVQR